jgi:hypothetical protein
MCVLLYKKLLFSYYITLNRNTFLIKYISIFFSNFFFTQYMHEQFQISINTIYSKLSLFLKALFNKLHIFKKLNFIFLF